MDRRCLEKRGENKMIQLDLAHTHTDVKFEDYQEKVKKSIT